MRMKTIVRINARCTFGNHSLTAINRYIEYIGYTTIAIVNSIGCIRRRRNGY